MKMSCNLVSPANCAALRYPQATGRFEIGASLLLLALLGDLVAIENGLGDELKRKGEASIG